MKRFVILSAVLALAASPAVAGSCSSSHAKVASADIVGTASSAGNFNTLVAAAKAAGLVETLQSEGPFTVFAPTDEAFSKLPAGTVDSLLADPDALREVLLYHVVPGKVLAADVVELKSAMTAQGSQIDIAVAANGVRINDANVVQADIEASNGVIHVIDRVILPSS
jgi:uncharacterized surface protein with fasciclin (FAS1) repeats